MKRQGGFDVLAAAAVFPHCPLENVRPAGARDHFLIQSRLSRTCWNLPASLGSTFPLQTRFVLVDDGAAGGRGRLSTSRDVCAVGALQKSADIDEKHFVSFGRNDVYGFFK